MIDARAEGRHGKRRNPVCCHAAKQLPWRQSHFLSLPPAMSAYCASRSASTALMACFSAPEMSALPSLMPDSTAASSRSLRRAISRISESTCSNQNGIMRQHSMTDPLVWMQWGRHQCWMRFQAHTGMLSLEELNALTLTGRCLRCSGIFLMGRRAHCALGDQPVHNDGPLLPKPVAPVLCLAVNLGIDM